MVLEEGNTFYTGKWAADLFAGAFHAEPSPPAHLKEGSKLESNFAPYSDGKTNVSFTISRDLTLGDWMLQSIGSRWRTVLARMKSAMSLSNTLGLLQDKSSLGSLTCRGSQECFPQYGQKPPSSLPWLKKRMQRRKLVQAHHPAKLS